MSMSIQERMALQARLSAASHRPPIPTPPKAAAPVSSAAQRMAKQAAVAAQNKAAANSLPPPPEPKSAPSMSAAERIQRQAITAAAQKGFNGKAEVNAQVIDYWHKRYADFQKNVAEKLALDPLYFEKFDAITGLPLDGVSAETSETKEGAPVEPEAPVVGIATAEGEVAITAPASEPVKDMPFQATPVIKPKRVATRKKKPAAKPIDPENDGVEEQATSNPFGVTASGESVGIQ